MIDWLLRYLRNRLVAIERREASAANQLAIREVCCLAGVAEMADHFVGHGMGPEAVARALATCARSRPC